MVAVVAAAVLIALVPGYLLTSALVSDWRWWERLAAAPGVGVGIVGIVGAVYHDAHIRFSLASVLPVLAAVAVVAGAVWNRRRGPLRHPTWVDLAVPAAALAAGAASVAVAVSGFHGQALPIYSDSALHATVAQATVQTGDAIPPVPEPVAHSSVTRPRTAAEATAALVSSLTGSHVDDSLVAVALVAVLLLPLGLSMLAIEATDSRRIGVIAPLVGLGMAMPKWPFLFGEYPLLLDATLVAPLIVAVVRSVKGRRCAAFIGLAVAAIFITHGLEAITAVVVGSGMVLGVVIGVGRPSVRRLLAPAAAAAGAAIAVILLLHLATASAPSGDTTGGSEAVRVVSAQSGVDVRWVFDHYLSTELGGILVGLLVLAGAAVAIARRRLRWAVFAAAFFFLALVDVMVTHRFGRIWERVYPWAVEDRLRDMEYWAVPLLVALAIEEICRAAAKAGRVRVSALAVAVATAAVAVIAAKGVMRDAQTYADIVPAYSKATAADVTVMDGMAAALRPGSLVLTDGEDDAGIWINALTPDLRYLPKTWMQGHPDDPRVVALQDACQSPQQAAAALSGVDAVFVGSRHSADATHPWTLDCIRRIGALRPVLTASASGHVAELFAVEQPAEASSGP